MSATDPAVDPLEPEEIQAVLAEAGEAGRADGWSGERRVAFLRAIFAGHAVAAAARAVGMTPQSARRLRARAPVFAGLWDQAHEFHVLELADAAMERALHGSERPVFSRGQMVGTRTHHHDRLLMQMLAVRDPLTYAPIGERERWLKLQGTAMAAECSPAPPED